MIIRFTKRFRKVAAGLWVLALAFPASAAAQSRISALEFDPGRLPFSVRAGNVTTSYAVNPLPVLPGEQVSLQIAAASSGDFSIRASGGEIVVIERHRWHWRAPSTTGVYVVEILRAGDATPMRFNAFVMIPFDRIEGGQLNGYLIGRYPEKPLDLLPAYQNPRGFIEVTTQNAATPLSPHFRLEQFLCKQPGDYPKYVVLHERLIHKLEIVLEKVNESGHYARTLHVMSGYRTPHYNRAIGNVAFSRHQFGDAADVFIDENGDGQMDDLNRDDRSDWRDGKVLAGIVDEVERTSLYSAFVGGLAVYKRNAAHGPFVHVDARGSAARWGL